MLVLNKQSGFTLIELLIGISLIGMLFALGIPSFKDWMQNVRIRNGTESVQSGLQLARAEAVRRNAQVQIVLGNGTGWTVSCVNPVLDLDGDGSPDCPGTGTVPDNIQTYSSSEGTGNVSVVTTNTQTIAGNPGVVFTGLGRVTPVPPGSIRFDFSNTNASNGTCVALGGNLRCLSLLVSTGGQIRMCDPAVGLTPTTPQGCV
jgi:type IV fimbrial biogenesis protein FimT